MTNEENTQVSPAQPRPMFAHLADFSMVRSGKQAFGFYLAYCLLGFILGMFTGMVVGMIYPLISTGTVGIQLAANRLAVVVAAIYSCTLAFLVLREKKLLNNFFYIFLSISALVLALFGGALFGLVPAAYLSTRKPKESHA